MRKRRTSEAPAVAPPVPGRWFFALALVTASGALTSLAESLGLFAVLSALATGSGILAGTVISSATAGRAGRAAPGRTADA